MFGFRRLKKENIRFSEINRTLERDLRDEKARNVFYEKQHMKIIIELNEKNKTIDRLKQELSKYIRERDAKGRFISKK